MANFSSTLNENKNINRSDPSRMYIGQIPLARLRPEKLDDMAIKKQILIIQEICGDIDPDIIAIVFHECDYNMQNTIARIKAGDYKDGGWKTAKPNNKKKNHNIGDQILNGSTQSDSERSHSQRTSPIPSFHSGPRRRRHEYYQYSSSRANSRRYENDSNRNHLISLNSNTNNKIEQNSTQIISSLKQKDEILTDEYDNNNIKKLSSTKQQPISSSSSSIPQKPVSMHRTIQFSTEPIDIQFGDIQWNNSIPIPITPSNSPIMTQLIDDQQSSSINNSEQQKDIQNNFNYINHQTTNEIDRQLYETTNRLSSSSISSSLPIPTETTSHLSDHLTDSSQQQTSLQINSSSSSIIDTTQLTSNPSEYTSPTSQNNNSFLSNILQSSQTNIASGSNSSAFTPYNTPGIFSSVPRDYSQTASTWNQQSSNYKITSKPNIVQQGNYLQQTSYQLPPQQQYFVGTYPYHTPTLYPVLTSVDHWSNSGYEPYSTYPTNYVSPYPTQQQYHPATPIQPTKYDQYSYDKDVFANYGQNRLSNNELTNSSQPTKDAPITSKLSANAASFSQGAPLTATSPGTAFYLNPFLYTLPTYYTSHQDRPMSYPSIDTRDNRHGASYGGNNNRNHYHQQQQQQRTHNNSTWHSQQ